MAFVDGEPLDASKLGDLELKVNNLAAKIPQIGASNTNISITGVQNNTGAQTQTTVQPMIQAANAGEWLLVPGQINKIDVKFPSAFPKTPHVVLTTRMSSTTKAWHPEVNVATGTSTSTGFTAVCFMPTGTTQHKVYLTYIAIAY
jgi:hypothetical protein